MPADTHLAHSQRHMSRSCQIVDTYQVDSMTFTNLCPQPSTIGTQAASAQFSSMLGCKQSLMNRPDWFMAARAQQGWQRLLMRGVSCDFEKMQAFPYLLQVHCVLSHTVREPCQGVPEDEQVQGV